MRMGQQAWTSGRMESPRLQMSLAVQTMARSLTSWSMSVCLRRARVAAKRAGVWVEAVGAVRRTLASCWLTRSASAVIL